MWIPLGKGLLAGIAMSFMLGTVFFSLIQTSIQNGWKKGALIAAGVVFSDMLFITLAILGASLISPDENNYWIQSGAIVVLLFLGINLLRNKNPQIVYPQSRFGKAVVFFTNGFLLNVLNPVNFLFWAGLATVARGEWGYSTHQLIVFFTGCLFSIFFSEVGISYAAHRIKAYLNEKILVWVNRVTGAVFIGFALFILGKMIYESLF